MNKKTGMEWKNYIVGLVDLLGQSSKLKELGSLWLEIILSGGVVNESSPKSIRSQMDNIYREVENFRKGFLFSVDTLRKTFFENSRKNDLPPSKQGVAAQMATNICTLHSFSDLVVLYAPLYSENADELLPRWRVGTILYACACRLFCGVRNGAFLRGGIEIGAGTELGNGDIYGPALVEAYELEKEVADYPRIVIGERLYDFIQSGARASDSGNFSNMMLARVDDLCKRMICRDEDGRFIVDYLGEKMAELSNASGSLWSEACSFVNEGKNRIEHELNECEKKGDQKLLRRFERLLGYYQKRTTFWG